MAAALQQTTITFQSRLPQAKFHTPKPVTASFSGGFSSLKIPKLAAVKSRRSRSRSSRGGGGGGAAGARMAESAAGSYASALADVAQSTGTLDTTFADMEKVDQLFSDPEIYNFFISPILDIEKKRQVIDDITATAKLQPHTVNFINILMDMKRIELIKEIVKEFEVAYNKLTNTELAIVTSVVKLESQHLAQIAKGVQRLTGSKNVRIKTVIDPSLVAGFTIRYGNSGSKLIDMSVKKQLEDIASQLDLGDIQLAV